MTIGTRLGGLATFLGGLWLLAGGGWLVPAPPVAAADDGIEATVRKLEKDIAAVRGLEFKTPVVAKVIPRPKDAAKQIQGYYNLKDKTLYLYNDIAGNYERGVLIHEMVHALQDQHFSLANLHQTTFDSDADLALAALIEGDATYTMIELLRKDQPRVAAMLDTPLEKAKNLRNAFLYAQGARYVKALKERGGWASVNSAYRFTPRTTAAILHPEGVTTIDLGPGTTRGELAIIELLAANAETAPLAVQAAAGWKADRARDHDGAKSWVIAFVSEEAALRCQQAIAKLRAAQHPDFKSVRNEPGAAVWHGAKGEVHAVFARGDRVLTLEAPTQRSYQSLLERLEGPLSLQIYTRYRQSISLGQLIDRLIEADLVCVGETHDSELHHRVQLQIIKALYARDERLGVGMEMFQKPFQKELDRHLAGESTETDFLKASEYHQRWGFDWALYRPIVDFCRKNGLPVAALNAPRELTRRLSKAGYAGLDDDEKKQLGEIDFHVKEHRAYWYDLLAKMHGKSDVSEEQKERSYQVMTLWDDYMAASAAGFQQERKLRRLVVLAGSGHIDRGFGIPARTVKRTGGKAATIHIEVDGDPDKHLAEPLADFLIIVK